jgi:hypothetical protein
MSQVNPEATYNTYMYDATYQRTLVSDIQYLVFLLKQGDGKYLLDELTFGEPEQLVQIQYVTPAPSALITLSDSIIANDSTLVLPADSTLQQVHGPNQETTKELDKVIDSTTKRLND